MGTAVRPILTTVLIVENECLVRIEVASQIEEMGFGVLVAGDADEAIALLDTHPEISLLVTDIRMPGSMDGVRLAHHVRRRWPPVKIIVVSGQAGIALADLPSGSLFLGKPCGPAALAEAIARISGAPSTSGGLAA